MAILAKSSNRVVRIPISTDDLTYTKAIIENPDDTGLRLEYANWLEQRGEPLGEFIRIQCQLSQLGPDSSEVAELRKREGQLLDEYERLWCDPLPRMTTGWHWDRGFVNRIEMGVKQFKHFRTICHLFPVQHLSLFGPFRNGKPRVSSIAESTCLSRLKSFGLHKGYYAVGAEEIHEFARSPHIRNLSSLHLHENTFGADGVRSLAASPQLGRLNHLSISCYGFNRSDYVGYEGLSLILDSPYLKNVTNLSLRNCLLDDSCCGLLVRSSRSKPFVRIDLSHNSIGDTGLAMLAESGFLEGVESIDLRDNRMSKMAARVAEAQFGSSVLVSKTAT